MMKQHEIPAFLITEAVLYIIFMSMDLTGYSALSVGWKYSGILLCLLFSILCAADGGDQIVPWALFFTALADLFLLVINAYYMAGVLCFFAAQMVYLIRLYRKTGKMHLPARTAAALLAVLILVAAGLFSPLNLAAVLYFSQLLVNTASSWMCKNEGWQIPALGFSLLVLCDICVGIYNLGGIMPAGLHDFSRIGMWLFYLPSQVLLVLSCPAGESLRGTGRR